MTPLSPSGDAAQVANSALWMMTPAGATASMGWMDGTRWLTLPISVEPAKPAGMSFTGKNSRPIAVGVLLERAGHRPARLEIEIVGVAPADVGLAARRQRARFETGLHAHFEFGQIMHVRRAHVEAAGRALRHDVGRKTAIRDDAVDALGLPDVLAQLRDRLIGA